MMTSGTDALVARLAASAGPVRRLRPPLVRAGLWLLVIALLAGLPIALLANLAGFAHRAEQPRILLELLGTALTGMTAVIAGFELSLPDRPAAWAWLPLPPLLLWIGASGYGCYRHWLITGPDGWALGESADCFGFILAVSLPLSVALAISLRRARPLTPIRVASLGGLGIAALAGFILQFFHPFDVTLMDLAAHLAAVGLVAGAMALGARYRR